MHDRPRVSGGAGREDALRLVDVYEDFELSCRLLFTLLREREPHESISHKAMPTWEEHCAFVASRPYQHWYVVEVGGAPFGACYLSKQREIGVAILKHSRGYKYGRDAVKLLMEMHPGRFLANVNPANTASAWLFEGLGFNLIQHTYATKEKT
jgi:RimJ/RimL family protein N-acetyltransferase